MKEYNDYYKNWWEQNDELNTLRERLSDVRVKHQRYWTENWEKDIEFYKREIIEKIDKLLTK